MPKSGKKSIGRNVPPDFKLSDFADCPASHVGRVRKSLGVPINEEVADIRNEEDTEWYERELEEFNFLAITNSETQKKLSKSKLDLAVSSRSSGNRYPVDLWFLIGMFIKPEDVKTFACICKDSHLVSKTYSFWISMYNRYYDPNISLPARLQPECIEQACCLKPSVVRALYCMYPHFMTRIVSSQANANVCDLRNLRCSLVWKVKEAGKFNFQFKFQGSQIGTDDNLSYRGAITEWWAHTFDLQNVSVYVNHNPQHGCKVLCFSTSHFVAVPYTVTGSRLACAKMSLARDMRRHSLQLAFTDGQVVDFDAVENLALLDWWHPQYPHNHQI